MAQEQDNPKPRISDKTRALARKVVFSILIPVVLIGAIGYGIYKSYRYVDKSVATVMQRPTVVLANRPAWMSDFMADQICTIARPAGGYSVLNNRVLKDIEHQLLTNSRSRAWIKQIRELRILYVNQPGDTLVLDCEFRVPIALVHVGDMYYYIDNEGYQLPERCPAEYLRRVMYSPGGKLQIRIIEGVHADQPAPGGKWTSPDLDAAIDLAKVLYGKPYTEEVVKIDVTNFAGRRDQREAQIVLVTNHNTQVRWGRPYLPQDPAEVKAGQKLDYMERIFKQYGRVDAGKSWVDLRFDRVTYPQDQAPAAAVIP